MSQPDAPVWVRGVAAVLALVASWWLVHTDAIRGFLGDSVAALSLGVVAVFVLRGTRQPLGLWPRRYRRDGFSIAWAMVIGGSAAGLIALAGASPHVTATVRRLLVENPGAVLLVMAGTVALAVGVGLVRQRRYARWYWLAVIAGLTPVLLSGILGWAPISSGAAPVRIPGLLAFFFWIVADTSRVFVTEELAFRRMLIGTPDRASTTGVLAGAGVSAVWLAIIGPDAPSTGWQLVHMFAVASVSGGLYVLSRSLLVAALYHGAYRALLTCFVFPVGFAGQAPVGTVVITAAVAVVVLAFVTRERRLIRPFWKRAARDAPRN